ncbi:D-alanyl-D-alanine carboxypeptidase [Nonomuraea sp. NN258]|uniref:D-alanyl-D-alanine carboxypeptidase family protein n=1 Tax=Nonomuraea antri TaxID=2730852 RepID=UPI0015688DFD|nr:D-alanyl-D-alanine carboxypeptidase family protein [Nonomuraea antri]NRQ39459.1 D-alanyl-D-alanine carboxypeptidase [Nonomuraea antri]
MRVTTRLTHALLGLAVTTGTLATAATAATAAPSDMHRDTNGPAVSSTAAYLVDAKTGEVRFSKQADTRRPVASITKAMTAYTVLQQAKPTDKVKVTAEDVRYASQGGASVAHLRAGDTLTVEDTLYALMLPSGADAAHVLARTYGPSVKTFVAEMNANAAKLGMKNTQYVNADGMPYQGGGYSTARDQVALAKAVLDNPTLKKITSTRYHSVPSTSEHRSYAWKNTNRLLGSAGALGVKTGYTRAAGYTLAFAAERDDSLLVGVVLGAPSSGQRFQNAETLLDWAAASDAAK